MFVLTRQIKDRLLDAADLVIDFATLGEYGLEPLPEPSSCRSVACPRAAQPTRSASPRSIRASIS